MSKPDCDFHTLKFYSFSGKICPAGTQVLLVCRPLTSAPACKELATSKQACPAHSLLASHLPWMCGLHSYAACDEFHGHGHV